MHPDYTLNPHSLHSHIIILKKTSEAVPQCVRSSDSKTCQKLATLFYHYNKNSEAVLYTCAEQRFKKMPKTSHSLSQSLPQHHSFILINAFLRTRCPSRPCSATTSLEKHAPDGNRQHSLSFTPPRAERTNSLRHDKHSIQQTNKQHKGSSRPGQGFSNIRPEALGFARFDRW
jgi:hypothetical protein